MNLTEACVRKPVLAWMLMAATIVFGVVAGSRIGISQFPDVDFPTINVSASWEGAAPEVMENEVVEPLEETLIQIEGIRNITSSSRQGSCNITVEIELSRDVDLALQDVQAKVSQAVRMLPRDMDPPTVSKSNPEDQPIMMVRLGGPYPQRVLSDYVRYGLKEKLQTIPGIGEISLMGTLERNVRIWLDAARLDEKSLTVQDVIGALQREHVELPAGRLETPGREINVRVLGEAIDLDTLRKIVVREVGGSPIYLSDVSMVEDGFEDVRRIARVDGGPAQGIGIKKQRGANAVAVAQKVRQTLDTYMKTLPSDMTVGITNDSTEFIRESVREIQFELLLSVVLTAFVCWLFLGSLSSTLNVILAIPMSLLGTVAIIYFLGFTFNTFTLLGLALAVGIVVDDAIMVMENIFRHREGGKALVPAALEGTKEIAFAALAATLAVVAIFIPVVFMKGIIGRYFLQFGITLCLCVLLSYVEAVTLAPARCSQFLKTTREGRNKIGLAVDREFGRLEKLYARVLHSGLRRPGLILVLAAILFAAAILVFTLLPSEFVPSQDQSRIMVRMMTAVGSDITETDGLVIKAEDIVRRHPEVSQLFSFVGGMGGGGVNSGMLYVTLVPPKAAEARPGRGLGPHPARAQRRSGHPGRHPGYLPAGLYRPAGFPGRVLRARLGLEPARAAQPEGHERSLGQRRRGRPRLGLPRRHARAAGDPGPGGLRRRRRLRRRSGHDHQRPGRRHPGREVQHGRTQARRPAEAHGRAEVQSRGHLEASGPGPQRRARAAFVARRLRGEGRPPGHHPARPGEGHLHLRQRRPGPRPGRGPARRRGARQDPAGRLPARPGRIEHGLPRIHEQPAVRHVPGHRHRLYDPGLSVQLVQGPGDDHHHPAVVDRRSGLRPAHRPAVAQYLQHDRVAAADGHRQEELHHPGRLRQRVQAPRVSGRRRPWKRPGRSG